MNTPTHFWRTVTTAVILLTIFLAVVSIKELKSIEYVGKSDQIVNTIAVNGTGDAYTIPDIATFSFTVTENGKTVAAAQTAATNKTNAALKSLKDAGIADKDIQTLSYNINPHYEYQQAICPMNTGICPPSRSVLTGYDVGQSVSVKVRDLSKAGDIFTSIGAIGVQDVNGLSFTVENIEDVRAQARNKAIAMAEAKAQDLAKQLGVTLVRVSSFYEGGEAQPMAYGLGSAAKSFAAADVAAPAPVIPSGEQKVTSNVTITYEIR